MSRAVPRRALAVLLTVAIGTFAGCGDEEPGALSEIRGEESPTEVTPSATPTAVSALPDLEDLDDGELVVGRLNAEGAEAQAVATAWIGFWRARMQAYTEADPGVPGLVEHGRGTALANSITYITTELRPNGLRQRGAGILGVNEITVNGDRAVVSGCLYNNGANVDADGRLVEQPTLFVATKDVVLRQDDRWAVADLRLSEKGCTYR